MQTKVKAQPSKTSKTMHYIDWGNDSIKVLGPNSTPLVIRSLYYNIPPYEDSDDIQDGTIDSPVLFSDQKRIHWGKRAREYKGYVSSVEVDKTTLIADNIFVALGPINRMTTYTTSIVLSVPRVDLFRKTFPNFKQEMERTHSYYHNDHQMKVTIRSIEVMSETEGSFRLAMRKGLAHKTMKTLIIDIGCGTCIYGLYEPDGRQVRLMSKEKSGVVSLVNMLRQDKTLTKKIPTPKPEVLMDGLRNQTFKYGSQSIDFKQMAYFHGGVWWRGLVSDAFNSFEDIGDEIGEILLTGGGANLAQAFGYPDPILPEAQLANLRGMALAGVRV